VALGYGQVVAFRAYLEIPKNSSRKCVWIRSQLQTSGVSLIDCPHNGGKDVADKMMITDLLAFAIDTPPPATVVLISGDRDFSYPISTMRSRGYTVCLIAPTQSNRGLLALASRVHEWSDVMRSSATKSTSAYSYRDPEHTHRNTETPKRSPLMPLRQVDNLPRRLQNTDLPCSHSEQHHAMKDLTIGDVPQKRKRRSSETEEGQLGKPSCLHRCSRYKHHIVLQIQRGHGAYYLHTQRQSQLKFRILQSKRFHRKAWKWNAHHLSLGPRNLRKPSKSVARSPTIF
jgi:hypothetical protein